jgi:hypothetical protein
MKIEKTRSVSRAATVAGLVASAVGIGILCNPESSSHSPPSFHREYGFCWQWPPLSHSRHGDGRPE